MSQKKYFFSRREHLDRLRYHDYEMRNNGVHCIDGVEGYILDEDQIPGALSLLKVSMTSEKYASREGVYIPELVCAASGVDIDAVEIGRDSSDELRDDNAIQSLLHKLSGELGMKILAYYQTRLAGNRDSSASQHPARNTDVFEVHFWGSTVGGWNDGNNTVCSDTAWGVRISGANWWDTSGTGYQIINPDNGKSIAEIIDNRLFIFFPFSNASDNGIEILKKIFEEVIDQLGGTPEERATRVRERNRRAFTRVFVQMFRDGPERARQAVETAAQETSSYMSRIIKATRGTKSAQRKLTQIEPCWEAARDQAHTQYAALWDLPQVTSVSVNAHSLVVTTDVICCCDPRSNALHALGRFEIRISMDRENQKLIQFLNLDQGKLGDLRPAPHVDKNGMPYLGETAELFAEMLAERDYTALVQFAIEFLEVADTSDSWGALISEYPLFEEEAVA